MEVQETKVKTKVRFTSLDVSAMVSYLKEHVVGHRVTNIYDVNPTTYLFKVASSDNKNYLLVENGVRFHLTTSKSQKNKMPSGFTMKFRKFLRAKRLQKVRQVGLERVVVLTFGSDTFTNHLILELYSQGNIILTDSDYKIIQCIRSHQFTEQVKTAVGELYPFEYAANIYMETLDPSRDNILAIFRKEEAKQSVEDQKKKGKKKNNQFKLKELLMKVIPCLFPQAAEHIILTQGLNPNEKCTPDSLQNIQKAGIASIAFLKQFQQSTHKGYLFYTIANDKQKYFDYSPFFPKSYENKQEKTLSDFSQAVDSYYLDFKRPQNEDDLQGLAWKKYEQIKTDQDSRLQRLINDQEESQLKAEIIQKNIDDVDAIIRIIYTMLQNGLSWTQIQQHINESKKTGNPLAELIHSINLEKNSVTVLLGDPSDTAQHSELMTVDINVNHNAFTNAKYYYQDRKRNKQKEIRTKEASEQVLKIAQKEAIKDIERKKNQRQQNVINARKPYWFEKFYWMLTSQGYLVISGRDSHQNELLVKKYMRAGDLYMHSDYGGAASTVIKNPTKEPLARPALEEAAIFTVCRSKAWDTKIISGAWWVNNDQVSKSAPTGEFLPTGSFMIRGKKNFIYPNKMEMGVTLLFRLDQSSALKHQENKKPVEEVKVAAYQLEIEKAHEEKLKEEEFTIVNLEANTKKKTQQQNQKNNKAVAKQEVKQAQEVPKEDSQEDSDEEIQAPALKKTSSKHQKQKQPSIASQSQPQPTKKNKKKIKKLQRYLQEQDEQEREIIMKMLGAKEMKHRRNEEEEEQQKAREREKLTGKKGGKEKKRDKDKFNLEDKEEKKIEKEKIPFLMKEEETAKRIPYQRNVQEKTHEKGIPVAAKKKEEVKDENKEVATKEVDILDQERKEIKEGKEGETPAEAPQTDKKEPQSDQNDSDDDDEEAQQQKPEENYEQDEKVLNSDMNDLTRLVGSLRMQDNYDALIAMCAPYPTISQNRFKIKLTPGGIKKGKAARNVLSYYTTMDLTQKQKGLLKGIPEQELINCLLTGVKLGGAGLLKLELKEKAEKKQIRKEKDVQKEKEREKQKKK